MHSTARTHTTPPDILASYKAWNTALFDLFFPAKASGRPVYFQVDEESLAEAGSNLPLDGLDPEGAFLAAVRRVLTPIDGNPFRLVSVLMESWSRSPKQDPPPCIALLGACVLAASRMQRDSDRQIAQHNYYARLNELLGWQGRDQPPNFNTVTGFWVRLNKWLNIEQGGRWGLGTATPMGHWSHIGYPISQCLLRRSDRAALPGFFEFACIPPGAVLDPLDLLPALQRWCRHSSCGLSQAAKSRILEGDKQVQEYIAGVVCSEVLHWDGEVREEQDRRSAPIVLRIEENRGGREFALQLLPRRPRDFPEAAHFDSDLGVHHLSALEGTDWYQPLPLAVEGLLERGLTLRYERFTLRFDPTCLVIARPSTELGGYISQATALLGEPLLLLCHSSIEEGLKRFLHENAEPGWVRAPGTQGLPSGWVAYLRVKIIKRSQYAAGELQRLVPTLPLSLSLEGGLKLDTSTWLTGGEPVLRAVLQGTERATVRIDDRTVLEVPGSTIELDLRGLGLEPGTHTVQVNGRSRRLTTVRSGDFASVSARRNTGQLVHRLCRHGPGYRPVFPSPQFEPAATPPEGEIWVQGALFTGQPADLPEAIPEPLLLPGGQRRLVLIGASPGMVQEYRPPSTRLPQWLFPENATPFSVVPPFKPVWLIRETRSKHLVLRLIGEPVLPQPIPWARGDLTSWKRWVRLRLARGLRGKREEIEALWSAYVAVAREL